MNNKANNKFILSAEIVAKQIGLIVIALALATIFLAASGYEPFAILEGIGNSLTADIAGTIRWTIPLALSGLAVCVTYKAEVFNLAWTDRSTWGVSSGCRSAGNTGEHESGCFSCVYLYRSYAGGRGLCHDTCAYESVFKYK